LKQVESNQLLFRLAMAIRVHPRITSIRFNECEISDLGALCLALTQKNQLVRLEFFRCRLEHCAAETLRVMLETNLVESLQILNCKADDAAAVQLPISLGLGKNKSLKEFQLNRNELDFKVGLNEMLMSNHNLVELGLSLEDNQHWDLFRSLERLKTLTSLSLFWSTINLPTMEAIMMMCMAIPSLQTLSLSNCTCDQNALEFLVRTLSSNKIITTLKYEFFFLSRPVNVDFGTLQVNQLVFDGVDFEKSSFLQSIDSIASSHHIKSLKLRPGELYDVADALEKICDTLIRQSKGPSELIVDVGRSDVSLLTEAMEHNTNLKTLKIHSLCESDLVTFAGGVSNMPGLRHLAFLSDCEYTEEFFVTLLESMERNTSLWTLLFDNLDTDETDADKYLSRIRYLLAINRVGRHRLMTMPIPVGLWAHVLERSSEEPDGIYFVLTGKPDIVTPTRKRKHQVDG
jgi:hypothetical protein